MSASDYRFLKWTLAVCGMAMVLVLCHQGREPMAVLFTLITGLQVGIVSTCEYKAELREMAEAMRKGQP